jgi:hypothetical protein
MYTAMASESCGIKVFREGDVMELWDMDGLHQLWTSQLVKIC